MRIVRVDDIVDQAPHRSSFSLFRCEVQVESEQVRPLRTVSVTVELVVEEPEVKRCPDALSKSSVLLGIRDPYQP